MIDLADPEAVLREAERRRQLREAGARTFSEEPSSPIHPKGEDDNSRIIDPIEYELDEKAIEHECDKLAQKAGARVVRFSHPGKTQQTPGIADRLYCFPALGFALWWEVKTPTGKQQRPGQVLFEELVTASGHRYACGGIGDLRHWLVTNVARVEDL